MNHRFITNQIRKYTKAKRETLKDSALTAIGIHVGLIEKSRVIVRSLKPEERNRVLYFIRQFCESEKLAVDAAELK